MSASRASQISSYGSRPPSIMEVPKLFLKADDREATDHFNLEAFLSSIRFHELVGLNDSDLEKRLSDVDALDLLNAVEELQREFTKIKLESHFMTDFLQKNDPKLLVGLETRRATAHVVGRYSYGSSENITGGGTTTRVSSKPSIVTTQSLFTTSSIMPSIGRKQTVDYRLNFRSKADMAEKTAADVEKRIAEMENKAMQKIKMLNTHIEEMRCTLKELQETANNFELHFVNNERDVIFLENAPEREVERKLRKFVNNWLKNGRILLSTMRLRINSLREFCQQQRNELLTKSDISEHISKVDFDQLQIERDGLLNAIEEKQFQLKGLKEQTSKASLNMSKEKKSLAQLEDESRRISMQIAEVMRQIGNLELEAKRIESKNKKDLKILDILEEQVEDYEAPSVSEYIDIKGELLALEKEEKMLKRKMQISSMKLKSILKLCNRYDDAATDIGSSL